MSRKRACQAKDPTTCRTHGVAAILERKERDLLTKITEALSSTPEPDCFSDAEKEDRKQKREQFKNEERAQKLRNLGLPLDPSEYDTRMSGFSGIDRFSQGVFEEYSSRHKEEVRALVDVGVVGPEMWNHMRSFTTNDMLNIKLRTGEALTPAEAEQLRSIDAIVNGVKSNPHPVRLYRGVKFDDLAAFQKWKRDYTDQLTGETASPAFTRTSTDAFRAFSFADTRGEKCDVVFEYVTDKGLYTGELVQTGDEREVILGRNEPFTIHNETLRRFPYQDDPTRMREVWIVQLS